MLSLKLFANPFETVIVVAMANIPITIPSVVRMARFLFALNALMAVKNDSDSTYTNNRMI